MPTLDEINQSDRADVIAVLGAVFEHAPWVAEAIAGQRPFATVEALLAAMRGAVEAAPEAARLELLTNHPELAGARPATGRSPPIPSPSRPPPGSTGSRRRNTPASRTSTRPTARGSASPSSSASSARPGRAARRLRGAPRLGPGDGTRHRPRRGLPHRRDPPRRPGRRAGAPRTTGRISTHVLDTAAGRPAPHVAVELHEWVSDTQTALVAGGVTNADGRTDAPLIGGRPVPIAAYELRFRIGDHFRSTHPACPSRPSSTWSPCASASPIRKGTTTCRWWRVRGATRPIAGVEPNPVCTWKSGISLALAYADNRTWGTGRDTCILGDARIFRAGLLGRTLAAVLFSAGLLSLTPSPQAQGSLIAPAVSRASPPPAACADAPP